MDVSNGEQSGPQIGTQQGLSLAFDAASSHSVGSRARPTRSAATANCATLRPAGKPSTGSSPTSRPVPTVPTGASSSPTCKACQGHGSITCRPKHDSPPPVLQKLESRRDTAGIPFYEFHDLDSWIKATNSPTLRTEKARLVSILIFKRSSSA